MLTIVSLLRAQIHITNKVSSTDQHDQVRELVEREKASEKKAIVKEGVGGRIL